MHYRIEHDDNTVMFLSTKCTFIVLLAWVHYDLLSAKQVKSCEIDEYKYTWDIDEFNAYVL